MMSHSEMEIIKNLSIIVLILIPLHNFTMPYILFRYNINKILCYKNCFGDKFYYKTHLIIIVYI